MTTTTQWRRTYTQTGHAGDSDQGIPSRTHHFEHLPRQTTKPINQNHSNSAERATNNDRNPIYQDNARSRKLLPAAALHPPAVMAPPSPSRSLSGAGNFDPKLASRATSREGD